MYWSPATQNDITWNFEKFLVNREGMVVKRYHPSFGPQLMINDVIEVVKNKHPSTVDTQQVEKESLDTQQNEQQNENNSLMKSLHQSLNKLNKMEKLIKRKKSIFYENK